MSTNILTPKSNGDPVDQTWFNDFISALADDFVGRSALGVPTAGKNLGNSLYPWGKIFVSSIVLDGSLVDFTNLLAANPYKVISGKTRTTSNQPAFLTPAGSGGGRSLSIQASVTPLVYEITGSTTELTSNISVSGLTAATATTPGTTNICLVNDSAATALEATRTWGEPEDIKPFITVDTMGTDIQALVGKRAAFKLVHGGTTEYFTAYIESTTKLTNCWRGFFYNSSLNPMNRVLISDNDTITLMKLGWLFLDVDGSTTAVTYNEPTYSASQPSSPSTGDYWFDLTNSLWKRYNGTTFEEVDRLPIGLFFSDTADTLGVRCVDFFAEYSSLNTLALDTDTVTTVKARARYSSIHVAGNLIRFGETTPTWNITTDLADTSDLYYSTETAGKYYYMYVKDTGALVISDVSPYYRPDLFGWYQPHNPWRCVGYIDNNSSGDFDAAQSDLTGTPFFLSRMHVTDERQPWRFTKSGQISGSASFSSTTPTEMTDLNTIHVCRNRPVLVSLVPDFDSSSAATFEVTGTTGGGTGLLRLEMQIKRGTTILGYWFWEHEIQLTGATVSTATLKLPPNIFCYDFAPGKGANTYKVFCARTASAGFGTVSASLNNCRLVMIDL